MDYALLAKSLRPEIILVITALGVLAADLSVWRRFSVYWRQTVGAMVCSLGCLLACAALGVGSGTSEVSLFGGAWVMSPKTVFLKQVMVFLIAATVWMARECRMTRHVGEFILVTVLGGIGGLLMVSTENLLVAFVALELLSLSLYVLTAFNKGDVSSVEAGMKYFLFGGVSAGFLLYGLSLLYGATGEIQLAPMAAKLASRSADTGVFLGMVMVSVGLGFKIAAVPFHLWTPETYQGAPAPSAALVASLSKIAGFFLLLKIAWVGWREIGGSGGWHRFSPGWMPVWCVMAALSMVIGNLAALAQRGLRRLLAFSAIAHSGYMLTGILSSDIRLGEPALFYYVVTYAVASLGAFAVVAVVERHCGSDAIEGLAGLGRRSPLVACALGVFLLSFAGIPPLAGFLGKFFLFAAALKTGGADLGLLWLVALALLMSAVALYYYLVVLKQMFVLKPKEGAPPVLIHLMTRILLVVCVLAVLLPGLFPNLIFSRL